MTRRVTVLAAAVLVGGCSLVNELPATCEDTCEDAPFATSECVDGRCVQTCLPGFDDCDGDERSGCETGTTDNPNHCGACGHDCEGGECLLGQCQPMVLDRTLNTPIGVATSGQYVAVISWDAEDPVGSEQHPHGHVHVFSRDSEGVTLLGAVDQQGQPMDLAFDGDVLFWSNQGTTTVPRPSNIYRVDLTTGASTILVSRAVGIFGIALDETHLYWVNTVTGVLQRLPKDGSSPDPEQLAAGLAGPRYLAIRNGYCYWTATDGTIGRTSVTGGEVLSLVSGQNVAWMIRADDTHLYWTSIAPAGASGVSRLPLQGGELSVLSSRPHPVWGVTLLNGFAYWTESVVADGTVRRAPVDGGGEDEVLAAMNLPTGMTSGERGIYWVNTLEGTLYYLVP